MKRLTEIFGTCALLIAASLATAQGPGRGEPREAQKPADADDLVTKMMVFDKNRDGKLTMAEVTDERLHRLVERADVDKDGVVTKEELTALAAKEQISNRGGGFGGGGPGGFGPPGGGGPGGPRMGGMPRPGEILPAMLRQRLNLTAKQEKQVADLQKQVDAKLEEILTADQRNQLKTIRDRGPGGFGPPGGPGGRPRGGPGGGPGGGRPGGGPPGGGEPPPPPPDQSR
jgi:EF hand